MSSFDRYCEKCGKDLTCHACGGTGKVKRSFSAGDLGKWCCGKLRSGNYCPRCGQSLKRLVSSHEGEVCKTCLGLGAKPHHFCKGF